MALVGRGWFQIESPDGETHYTSAGAFNTNADGQLVTIDGYTVVPGITFPPDIQRSRDLALWPDLCPHRQ
jgi:flagellar basal-body rod protein FlgG